MKLLKMEHPQCLIFSAAMVLGEDPQDLCTEIGHDGLERIWDLPTPRCYRGHHIQEIQDLFVARGRALYEVELYPASGHPGQRPCYAYSDEEAERRLVRHLTGRMGILISPSHAVAWDGKIVFDPNGLNYPIDSFRILTTFILA